MSYNLFSYNLLTEPKKGPPMSKTPSEAAASDIDPVVMEVAKAVMDLGDIEPDGEADEEIADKIAECIQARLPVGEMRRHMKKIDYIIKDHDTPTGMELWLDHQKLLEKLRTQP